MTIIVYENGHDAAALLPSGSHHTCDYETGWKDATAVYVTDGDGKVIGFRKDDGSVASEKELEADATRYAKNFLPTSGFSTSTIIRMCAQRPVQKHGVQEAIRRRPAQATNGVPIPILEVRTHRTVLVPPHGQISTIISVIISKLCRYLFR